MDGGKRDGSEFEWEREFRRIDARVAACMAELPSVIDLPGEDELLRKRVAKKKPEVAIGSWEFPRQGNDADFEDIGFPENWRDLDGADIYTIAENLAGNWCRGLAVALPPSSREIAIEILCRHGKFLGYSVDLVDAARDDDSGIRVAICKRLAAEIEAVLVDLDHDTIPQRVVARHRAALQELRQKTLDLLFKQRPDR
jgi:hypothetical protein